MRLTPTGAIALIVAMAFATMLALVVSARAVEPGQKAGVYGFCIEEGDALALAKAVADDGGVGYRRVMRARNSCFDSRLGGNGRPFGVEFLEYQWTVTHKDGRIFDFWTVRDSLGLRAYSWDLTSTDEEDA